jgi:hypothetical protein
MTFLALLVTALKRIGTMVWSVCCLTPAALLTFSLSYYEDRDALKAAGNWCYERIHEQQFTWPVITKKMLRIVEEVLNQKPSDQEFKGFGTPAKIV